MAGEKVSTVIDETQPAGAHTLRFDASVLPSGIYFYKMQAGNYSQTRKMIVTKN
jgi:hypothetical protein